MNWRKCVFSRQGPLGRSDWAKADASGKTPSRVCAGGRQRQFSSKNSIDERFLIGGDAMPQMAGQEVRSA